MGGGGGAQNLDLWDPGKEYIGVVDLVRRIRQENASLKGMINILVQYVDMDLETVILHMT